MGLHTKPVQRRSLLRAAVTLGTVGVSPFRINFGVAQTRPLKIGVLLPLTGPFAFAASGALEGFKDGVDYVNEVLNGVLGRKLELLVEDTAYDVAKAVAAFNRIITRERPDELLFVYGDSTASSKALAPEITRLKIPFSSVTFANELADPSNYPNIFIFSTINNDQIEALLRQVRFEKGRATIAVVYANTEAGRDPLPYLRKRAGELGMQIVSEQATPPAISDATPIVLNLKRAEPDYVLFCGYAMSVEPLVLRSAAEIGLRSRFMGTTYSGELALIQRAGRAADGFLVALHIPYWYESVIPIVAELRRFRERKRRDTSYQPTYYMGSVAVVLGVAEAMRRAAQAGRLSREGLTEYLGKIGDYDGLGVVKSFAFTNNRLPYARLFRASVKDGRFNAITDWIKLA